MMKTNSLLNVLAAGMYLIFAVQLTSCNNEEDPKLSITSFTPSRGAVGSTVTIEGIAFSTNIAENIVVIGAVPATVTAATTTRLSITVPEGATIGKISMTVKNITVQSTEDFLVGDRWEPMPDVSGAKTEWRGYSFVLNGKAYKGVNLDRHDLKKDFLEYDPATNTWGKKQDYPGTPRLLPFGFGIGTKGYVAGGFVPGQAGQGLNTNDVWEYDAATNTWTKKKDFALGNAGVSLAIGSKGYVGGNLGNRAFWEYDPTTDNWTRKADVPAELESLFAFTIGSKGYIGGKVTSGGTQKHGVYEYDPAANIWTRKADLPQDYPTMLAASFAVDSKGYAIGASSTQIGTGTLYSVWEFDPLANTWIQKANLPGYADIGFSIGDNGYMCDAITNKFYRYIHD